jgi:D-3-phosphoglycerate dehydrogenase / 2-oxoglutarate reductase
MDLLILEPLDSEVVEWLTSRHSVRYAPELVHDQKGFRDALRTARALVLPASIALDGVALKEARELCAIGRVTAGVENIDQEACQKAGIEVVRSLTATAQAEAEFMVGALLSMLRRVGVVGADGSLVGREIGSSVVGLVGMTPAARLMSQLLSGFGTRVVGYDPAVHARDKVWDRWQVAPVGLRELIETCDGVCVQLAYFSRYQGLLGDRVLPHCKPDQVMVCISHSALFDEQALAQVLASGRMAACWVDSLEPGSLAEGRPLHGLDTLQVTPRVASTTRESRLRSAWAVVKRLDELLTINSLMPNDFALARGNVRKPAAASVPTLTLANDINDSSELRPEELPGAVAPLPASR